MLNISTMNSLTHHALLALIVYYYGNKHKRSTIMPRDNLLDIAGYMADNYSDFTVRHRPNYKMLADNFTLYRAVTKCIDNPDSVSPEVYDLVLDFIDFTDHLIYEEAVKMCDKLITMLESDTTRAGILEAWFDRVIPHITYNATAETMASLRFFRGDK